MTSTENITIHISEREQSIIEDLIIMLNSMPIPLTNDDYLNIIRAIADKDTTVDEINDLLINYN